MNGIDSASHWHKRNFGANLRHFKIYIMEMDEVGQSISFTSVLEHERLLLFALEESQLFDQFHVL